MFQSHATIDVLHSKRARLASGSLTFEPLTPRALVIFDDAPSSIAQRIIILPRSALHFKYQVGARKTLSIREMRQVRASCVVLF